LSEAKEQETKKGEYRSERDVRRRCLSSNDDMVAESCHQLWRAESSDKYRRGKRSEKKEKYSFSRHGKGRLPRLLSRKDRRWPTRRSLLGAAYIPSFTK